MTISLFLVLTLLWQTGSPQTEVAEFSRLESTVFALGRQVSPATRQETGESEAGLLLKPVNEGEEWLIQKAEKALPLLLRTLQEGNPDARMAAARILAMARKSEAVEPLAVLLEDTRRDVAHTAGAALAVLGAEGVAALVKATKGPVSSKTLEAYWALENVENPSSGPALREVLKTHSGEKKLVSSLFKSPGILAGLARPEEFLDQWLDRAPIPVLNTWPKDLPGLSERVRKVWKKEGVAQEIFTLIADRRLEDLRYEVLEALRTGSEPSRYQAAQALGAIGKLEDAGPLLELLATEGQYVALGARDGLLQLFLRFPPNQELLRVVIQTGFPDNSVSKDAPSNSAKHPVYRKTLCLDLIANLLVVQGKEPTWYQGLLSAAKGAAHSPESEVRRGSYKVFSAALKEHHLPSEIKKEAMHTLVEGLKEEDPFLARRCLDGLREGEERGLAPALREILATGSREQRHMVLQFLREAPVPALAPDLLRYLDSLPPFLAGALQEALEALPSAALQTACLSALQDPSPAIREAAASLLGKKGSPDDWEPLVHACGDPEMRVQKAAVYALGRLQYRGALDQWKKAAVDPENPWYDAALWALGSSRDLETDRQAVALAASRPRELQEALAAFMTGTRKGDGVQKDFTEGERKRLLGLLKTPLTPFRVHAAKALAYQSQPEGVAVLLEAAGASETLNRESLLQLLGDLGAKAVPVLVETLGGEDPYLCVQAADALHKIDDPAVLDRLLPKLDRLSPAAQALLPPVLARYDWPGIVALFKFGASENPGVRRHAARALARLSAWQIEDVLKAWEGEGTPEMKIFAGQVRAIQRPPVGLREPELLIPGPEPLAIHGIDSHSH